MGVGLKTAGNHGCHRVGPADLTAVLGVCSVTEGEESWSH